MPVFALIFEVVIVRAAGGRRHAKPATTQEEDQQRRDRCAPRSLADQFWPNSGSKSNQMRHFNDSAKFVSFRGDARIAFVHGCVGLHSAEPTELSFVMKYIRWNRPRNRPGTGRYTRSRIARFLPVPPWFRRLFRCKSLNVRHGSASSAISHSPAPRMRYLRAQSSLEPPPFVAWK